MTDGLQKEFVRSSVESLQTFRGRIETCLGKLTADQVWARGSENENAIGNLVLHLCGNMRQWIISGVGGAPDHRQRDAEFAARGGMPAPELLEKLRTTVDEAIAVIQNVTVERLLEPLTIQNYNTTGLSAIYHVVEHVAQHTGQIIFATKMLTSEDLGFYGHLNKKAVSD
jgi:uncharacterized damage-inducible protein DinB